MLGFKWPLNTSEKEIEDCSTPCIYCGCPYLTHNRVWYDDGTGTRCVPWDDPDKYGFYFSSNPFRPEYEHKCHWEEKHVRP